MPLLQDITYLKQHDQQPEVAVVARIELRQIVAALRVIGQAGRGDEDDNEELSDHDKVKKEMARRRDIAYTPEVEPHTNSDQQRIKRSQHGQRIPVHGRATAHQSVEARGY